MVGLPLFAGATLQQVGLQYTTASKASFLTATYILMVPIMGIFLKETLRITHIAGALLAMAGVYFMSITEDFSISSGDLMMLLCALGFTIQIHAMTYLTQRFSPILLSSGQFFVAGVLNFILAFLFETPTLSGIGGAVADPLYRSSLDRRRLHAAGRRAEISPAHRSLDDPQHGNGLWRHGRCFLPR